MKLFRNYKSEILLFVICFILFLTNYSHGAFLTGWDNLQTDFNPLLGIKRSFFAVWQEYQSFGLLAGMGHAADLVRAIFIYLLSFILPQSMIRYFFHMLLVFIGGLGVIKLLEIAGLNNEKKSFSFIGALFYIFNFGNIQMIYLPFESFTMFLAFLPWELWAFLNLVTNKFSKRNLFLFFIINLLATPQAVSQQLFVVYNLILGLFSVGIIFKTKTLLILKRIIVSFIIIFLINSFWLLPQIYFLKTSANVVREAKINQLATDDVWYSNKDKGNIKDFLAFQGFFYERLNKDKLPLFLVWKNYRENPFIKIIIYGTSAICLLGILTKSKFRISFLLTYVLVAFSLLTDTFPFDYVNESIRNNSFFNQVFRSPFTKYIIPYALLSSYFFSFGLFFIYQKATIILKFINFRKKYVFELIIASFLFLQVIPAFQGNYIAKDMKIKIPQEYFLLMQYFQNIDKNKRIALLPEQTFWGWLNYSWGYDGSGFLWYGIEQPIVSRTFDVWSDKSESYFWEIKNVLESEDEKAFEKVLEKFNINYLIFDRSLLPITSSTKAIQYDRLETLLKKSQKIKLIKSLNFISIYEIKQDKKIDNFVWAANSLPNIGPFIKITNEDTAFKIHGDYITSKNLKYNAFYPFLDLTTQSNLKNKQWNISESYNNWYINRALNFDLDGYKIATNSLYADIKLYDGQKVFTIILPINIIFEQKNIKVKFPKILVKKFDLGNTQIYNCADKKKKIIPKKEKEGIVISTEKNVSACFSFEDLNLDQTYGYLLKTDSQNIKGPNLSFYILDKTKEQAYIEDRLINNINYYVLGSRFKFGKGFAFTFQNDSLKNIPSINKLDELSLYLLPFSELKLILIEKEKKENPNKIIINNFDAKKINYYLYSISIKNTDNKNIILSQSFHEGWKAYQMKNYESGIMNYAVQTLPFLFGQELKEHVLVNNWENGWILPDNYTLNPKRYTLVIFFWPQYLECFGFLLLFATLVYVLRYKEKAI